MRLPDLLAAVRRPLRDPDVGDVELIDYANEVLREAASWVFLPDLEAAATVPVPAGETQVALPGDYHRQLFFVKNGEGVPLTVTSSANIRRWHLTCPPAGRITAVAEAGSVLRVFPAPDEDQSLVIGYFRLPQTLEQVAGKVTVFGGDKTLRATTPLFSRFHAGDVFRVDGPLNAGEYTVVSQTGDCCTVAESVVDEAAVTMNVSASTIEAIPLELQRNVLVNGILAKAFDASEDAVEGKRNTAYYRELREQDRQDLRRAIVRTGYRAPRAGTGEIHLRSLA